MSTPTPAPALTDEEIDGAAKDAIETLKWAFFRGVGCMCADDERAFTDLIAAVVAKAKREAAEEIAADLREWADAVIGETGMRSDGATLRWAAARIGATR